MGLGLHGGGAGVAKFFCRQGARVLVTDLKTKEQLRESLLKLKNLPIKYVFGKHKEEDFMNTDLVIKNPAVPRDSYYLKIAKKHKIPIETDITIFFKLCKASIIGVTGTNGKSTVATLIHYFLKSKYELPRPKGRGIPSGEFFRRTSRRNSNTFLAGNIGRSPLEILSKINKKSRVVLELSSFELEDLDKSPNVAVITSIYPDHLDRYKNLKEYIEAKKIIFKYQKNKDILLLNYDNLITRKFSINAPSKLYFYSKEIIPKKDKLEKFACYIKNNNIFYDKENKPIFSIKDLKLYGEHNLSNILAATSIAKILKIPSNNIKKVISNFKGVANRQEFVKEIKGVKYFNDTTATMPEAAIAATKTFSRRFPNSKIVLIAGGQDKNLNYKDLAEKIQKRISCLILLPGTASDKIEKFIKSFIKYKNCDKNLSR